MTPSRPVRRIRDRVVSAGLSLVNACMPKRASTIALHSFPDFSDEVISLLEETTKRGYEPVVLLEDATGTGGLPASAAVPGPYRAVAKNSLRGWFHYLTASVVITSHGLYRPHRPARGQVVVNIWHGELGKPVARFLGERPPVQATHATALSAVGRAFVCGEFGLEPRRVLVVGAPRNDRMITTDRDSVRRALLGDTPARRLLVWLPTYRDHGPDRRGGRVDGVRFTGAVPLSPDEQVRLDDWLSANDTVLVVKPHPSALAPQHGQYRRIVVVDQADVTARSITTGELLGAADCLITDASSVWVDFLLQDEPVMFFFPDIAEYEASRGLYLQPYDAWVPGPLLRDGDELLVALDRWVRGDDDYADARRTSRARLHRFTDEFSTARLLDELGL